MVQSGSSEDVTCQLVKFDLFHHLFADDMQGMLLCLVHYFKTVFVFDVLRCCGCDYVMRRRSICRRRTKLLVAIVIVNNGARWLLKYYAKWGNECQCDIFFSQIYRFEILCGSISVSVNNAVFCQFAVLFPSVELLR